ncbi:MAG: hypothetical protein WDO12_06400 [Pseudomonadota bacterium]
MSEEPSKDLQRDKWIDSAATATRLRDRVLNLEQRKVLISRLQGSDQARDLTVPPNCNGFGRIRHFRRATSKGWPLNPLPIDPATRALQLPTSDLLRVQAFQNAACAWRCWYCFVPFPMLSANPKLGSWMTAEDLIDLYAAEVDRPAVIDLTGGSPDLTPEWVLWVMRALRARGLDQSVYLWSDDNLSTDYYWRYLSAADRDEISTYPMYGRVACLKGFDEASFSFNTRADPASFSAQFDILRRLLEERIDCYCYATFTAPSGDGLEEAMIKFVDRLQNVHHNLPLRTIPLRIESFSPCSSAHEL